VRFLIVDDDAVCRSLLKAILSPYARCDLAFDGGEAIDAFRLALEDHDPYDLVCLDIMMPSVSGHQALQSMRELERKHGIFGSDGVKVIMTTAVVDSKHCIRAFEEGCENYCTKPLDEKKVRAAVRALLGELPERAAVSTTAAPSQRQNAAAAPHDARYLVVDDDGVCRALLEAMLSPYGRCHFADCGREAVDAFRRALEQGKPFDLVCLDIMMPGMNGHDALKAIRAIEAEHGILGSDGVRVIMTTALRDSKHCVQSFREGCESYVTKPVHEGEFLQRMRELSLLPQVQA
jgi:two-component system, chemotaxis family, chemotaxis protein CheY